MSAPNFFPPCGDIPRSAFPGHVGGNRSRSLVPAGLIFALLGLEEPAVFEVDDRMRGPCQEPNREFFDETLLEEGRRQLGTGVIHIAIAREATRASRPISSEVGPVRKSYWRSGSP